MQQSDKGIVYRWVHHLWLHPHRFQRTAYLQCRNQKINIRFIISLGLIHSAFLLPTGNCVTSNDSGGRVWLYSKDL